MRTSGGYRLIGRFESGYSVKVRSALRFKGFEPEWLDRFREEKLFRQHARVPLIPLLFLPDGTPMQDSTPILQHLETAHPEPSFHPADADLRYLSELLEEYGDEWVNKLMFHYRWGYSQDQKRRGNSLAEGMIDGWGIGWSKPLTRPIMRWFIVRRMVPRLAFAGANENNAPILVHSFAQLSQLLETHLQKRPYLLGGRPGYADFGVWGQLVQAWMDPSGERLLNDLAPAVVRWIRRMEDPRVEGDFETLDALRPTLLPLFAREVGPRFLAWSDANATSWGAGEETTDLQMEGRRYWQKTFKYPVAGLQQLREKFSGVAPEGALTSFLAEAGCLHYLAPGS